MSWTYNSSSVLTLTATASSQAYSSENLGARQKGVVEMHWSSGGNKFLTPSYQTQTNHMAGIGLRKNARSTVHCKCNSPPCFCTIVSYMTLVPAVQGIPCSFIIPLLPVIPLQPFHTFISVLLTSYR